MATKQTIRKNIVTGEWEHYVDVPLFENNNWVPGIYTYYGDFPITETTQSLIRNAEGYLLSYEDVKYADYKVVTKRNLPTYTQVKNIYDIQFSELYEPEPYSIAFTKTNANYDDITLIASPKGGYPYRYPNIHYDFYWNVSGIDASYIPSFEAQRGSYTLNGMPPGTFELTIIDANKVSYTQTVEITQDDLLQAISPPTVPKFAVNLSFWSDDENVKRGYLRAKVLVGESIAPYVVEWKSKSSVLLTEIKPELSDKQILDLDYYVGYGDYSIIIKDANGNIATDSIEVTIASFPLPHSSDDSDASGRPDADR